MNLAIVCPNCHKFPKFDMLIKDRTKCIIKYKNYGKENSVQIEDLINLKTEYANPFNLFISK